MSNTPCWIITTQRDSIFRDLGTLLSPANAGTKTLRVCDQNHLFFVKLETTETDTHQTEVTAQVMARYDAIKVSNPNLKGRVAIWKNNCGNYVVRVWDEQSPHGVILPGGFATLAGILETLDIMAGNNREKGPHDFSQKVGHRDL